MKVTIRVDGAAADSVPALDRGLQFGDGLFETLAVVDARPRLIDRHLDRLYAGCARLALPAPERETLCGELADVATGLDDGVIKLIVTRGSSGRGYAPPAEPRPRRIVIATRGRPAVSPARLAVCATRLATGGSLAGIKHLNRLEQVMAMRELEDAADCNEGLMRDSAGRVVEAVSANLFLVRDGGLVTPSLERCGVAGVMRSLVIETAADAGLGCEIADLRLADVQAADDIFLTSSLAGIREVAAIDGRPRSEGAVTRRLRERLESRLAGGVS